MLGEYKVDSSPTALAYTLYLQNNTLVKRYLPKRLKVNINCIDM